MSSISLLCVLRESSSLLEFNVFLCAVQNLQFCCVLKLFFANSFLNCLRTLDSLKEPVEVREEAGDLREAAEEEVTSRASTVGERKELRRKEVAEVALEGEKRTSLVCTLDSLPLTLARF